MEDAAALTGGRFAARIDAGGNAPTGFEIHRDRQTAYVRRGDGEPTEIDTGGLGLTALVHRDGRVLGYGGIGMDDLPAIADAADAAMGMPSAGEPIDRLAAHGLHLVLPIDEMPHEIASLLLAERVPEEVVEMGSITTESVREARRQHDREHGGHQHEPGCSCCEDGMDETRDRIDDMIDQAGHMVACVAMGDGTVVAYTVGLAEMGWPELAVTGLGNQQATMVLNRVATALRRSERAPQAGQEIAQAVSVPVRLRDIDGPARPLARVAADRLRRQDIDPDHMRVLQVVWPDAAGRWPGEEGSTMNQPLL